MESQLELALLLLIFLSVGGMNLARRNRTLIFVYLFQSTILVSLLGMQAFQENSLGVALVAITLFLVKVIATPRVLFRVINKKEINFSASTYLNIPLTLGSLVVFSVFAQSEFFAPLVETNPETRMMLVGSMLMSFFLIVNRKGALSQIIGVLSLENSIFAFGHFLGIRQSNYLEIAMLFDVFFWVIVSSVFVQMVYKHFGSMDVSELKELKK